MSPRPCRCPCACDPLPLSARKRMLADRYVSALTSGETIDDDPGGTDARYVAPFREYLPAALMAAGFRITARLVQSRVVTTVYRD
jgi:hypothetical protein